MQKLLVLGGRFVLAGLCEIGGGCLIRAVSARTNPSRGRSSSSAAWSPPCSPITAFGRVYAAYGGIFIALTLA
jgi:drug/metabolite transporter superfamily protein YnfA